MLEGDQIEFEVLRCNSRIRSSDAWASSLRTQAFLVELSNILVGDWAKLRFKRADAFGTLEIVPAGPCLAYVFRFQRTFADRKPLQWRRQFGFARSPEITWRDFPASDDWPSEAPENQP